MVSKLVSDHKKQTQQQQRSAERSRHSLSGGLKRLVSLRNVTGWTPGEHKLGGSIRKSAGADADQQPPFGCDAVPEQDPLTSVVMSGIKSSGVSSSSSVDLRRGADNRESSLVETSSQMMEDSSAVIRFEEKQSISLRNGTGNGQNYDEESSDEEEPARKKEEFQESLEVINESTSFKKHEHHRSVSRAQRRRNQPSSSRVVVVNDEETPSRTLVVPMVKLQETLLHINTKVMTGLVVSHDEWDELRSMTVKLGDKFQSGQIQFHWEDKREDVDGVV